MRQKTTKKKNLRAGWGILWLILLLALPGLPPGQQPIAHAAGGVELVAGGEKHTCIVINGGVQCWGDNTSGQLGDGTTEQRLQPVNVSGLTSGVTALAAGDNHTCAVVNGGVKCWGNNQSGQLGNNSSVNSSTPVDVTGLTSDVSTQATALTAGANHTCALTTTGGVKCWGENGSGQLGNNSSVNSSTPVDVADLSSGITALVAGTSHTCALTDTGGVKCWGSNGGGRLGNNTTTPSPIPVNVLNLGGTASALAAGFDHTCAVVNGGVKCWGDNRVGQLGNDSTTNSPNPVQVSNITSGATVIVAGFRHTCALTANGVQCWGLNNTGQLGNGQTTNSTVPVPVQNLSSGVNRLAAGTSHTCALTNTGGMQCWGANNSGQLGDGSLARLVPVNVEGLSSGVTALAAGTEHNCAIIDGGVKCWGYNNRGQLGNNSTANSATPVAVSELSSGMSPLNTALAAGAGHSCALTASGGVRCWGDNTYGQLGDDSTTQRLTPVAVVGLPDGSIVTALAAGNNHTCALLSDGRVYCWGRNNNGQLGGATATFSTTPSLVQGSAGVTALVAGADHTCVLSNTGERCWGANSSGQLGNQQTTSSATPVLIGGLSGTVSTLAAGATHTCAMTDTGVQCWGANASGQLGDGTIESKLQPVTISEFAAVVPLGAGANHTCAATVNGASCWGANGRGQLGDGTQVNKLAPVAVQNLGKPAVLAGGSEHTCALVNGGVKCWGSNFRGQLGDGTNAQPLTPVTVIGTSTTLKLTVTPDKLAGKQPLTLKVEMTASDGQKPTGSVAFFSGSEELGRRTLDSEGIASLNISGLPAGRYTLIARYAGDNQYMPSKDEQRVTVGVETAIALSAAPNPSRLGQTVTFTATVKSLGRSDQKLEGNVTFFNGAEELATVPLADNFTASTTTAELPLGEYLITATYTGNDYYISSTTDKDKDEAVIQVVEDRIVTTTTIEVTPPGSAIFGQPIIFTITVTGEEEGTPTGSITIKNGPDILAENIELQNGRATWSPGTRQFPVGTYRITADYSGDAIYQGGFSMVMDYVVRLPDPVQTRTTITADPSPSINGEPVTFTATVSPTEGDGRPTGMVAFYSGNQPLGGKVSLTNGQAVLIESLPLGTYQIWAEYEGTAAYTTSRSAELTHEVVRRPTTTTLTAAPNPATLGQTVTFNVVVAAAAGQPKPTGTVKFYNGDTELGTQELTNGTANLTTATLPVGQHTITVVYQGDDDYASSTSNEVIQEVRSPVVTGESRVYLPLIQR